MVVTHGGSGVMYEYSPKTGVWGVIADMRRIHLSGIVHNPKDDTIYGVTTPFGSEKGVTLLYRYNAQGAVVKSVELASPVFPGLLGRLPFDGRTQLAVAGDHIAVLVGTGGRFGEERPAKPESFLFFLDPKTDKVKLAWKE